MSDASEAEWERKLARYLEAGIQELARFDPDGAAGRRLRVWDRIEGDLVEREVHDDRTPCETLSLHWVVTENEELGATLRIARDAAGRELMPTPDEERSKQERRAGEASRRAAEEARGRAEAEQRVAELEAKLRELTAKRKR